MLGADPRVPLALTLLHEFMQVIGEAGILLPRVPHWSLLVVENLPDDGVSRRANEFRSSLAGLFPPRLLPRIHGPVHDVEANGNHSEDSSGLGNLGTQFHGTPGLELPSKRFDDRVYRVAVADRLHDITYVLDSDRNRVDAASQRVLVTLEGRGGLALKPLEFPVVLRCVSTRPFVQVSSDLRRQNLQRAIQARVFPPSRQTLRHRFYLSGASTESFCQNLVGVILDHPPSTSFNR